MAASTQRFYAEGEERTALRLPAGYGLPNKATDRWYLLYMLMNHKPKTLTGYVRYRVTYVRRDADAGLSVWLDVRNCTGLDPSFDVPGTGKRFSAYVRTMDWTAPQSGRIVAAGGHLHGGGIRLELHNTTCGTTPFVSEPTWGGPIPHPILHEPGPTHMSQFTSAEGIPVAAGQTLRLQAVYDNGAPHTRTMGIMILYMAAGQVTGCGPTPKLDVDLGHPSYPPVFTFPLPFSPEGSSRVASPRATFESSASSIPRLARARHDVHLAVQRHSSTTSPSSAARLASRRRGRSPARSRTASHAGDLQALLLAAPRADEPDHRRSLTHAARAASAGSRAGTAF